MEILREQIKHIKKIPVILHKCLEHTFQNPQDSIFVGAMWINDKIFIFNNTIFSNFIDKDDETIRRNFRQHGFEVVSIKLQEKRRIFDNYNLILFDSKSWVGRTNKFYNSQSSEEDAKNLPFRKTKSNQTKTPQTEYTFNLDELDFDADFFNNYDDFFQQ